MPVRRLILEALELKVLLWSAVERVGLASPLIACSRSNELRLLSHHRSAHFRASALESFLSIFVLHCRMFAQMSFHRQTLLHLAVKDDWLTACTNFVLLSIGLFKLAELGLGHPVFGLPKVDMALMLVPTDLRHRTSRVRWVVNLFDKVHC